MRNNPLCRYVAAFMLIIFILVATNNQSLKSVFDTPEEIRITQGEKKTLPLNLPFAVTARSNREGIVKINGDPLGIRAHPVTGFPVVIEPAEPGRVNIEFRLFGIVPLRRVEVDVIPPTTVKVGGHAIGVLLRSRGILVVGFLPIADKEGRRHNPALDAGIHVGDVLLRVDGQTVVSDGDVVALIEKAGSEHRSVVLELERRGTRMIKTVHPIRCDSTGRHRIGLLVRDGTAGVGTLTFYDPKTHKYAALGHMITDEDTRRPVNLRDGQLVRASIMGIQYGKRGEPGEKIGVFVDPLDAIGTIEKNTEFGIIGTMKRQLTNDLYPGPVQVALASDVHPGPAEIVTVVEGERLERFSVEIVKVFRYDKAHPKNIMLRITDQRLVARTGGIIQGMSGSPIIQNGKLVGAITHVLINDPLRGYGVFAELMMRESGVFEKAALYHFMATALKTERNIARAVENRISWRGSPDAGISAYQGNDRR